MKPSVLVVDDEPNIVVSLEFLMKQAGYDVRIARNGEEALKALEERVPDLMLPDAMMPKRNGYDVCQTVRTDARWTEVRIIMLTAKRRDVEREKGLVLGAEILAGLDSEGAIKLPHSHAPGALVDAVGELERKLREARGEARS